MGNAIDEILPQAIGMVISPVPIIAIILMFLVLGVKLVGDGFGGLF